MNVSESVDHAFSPIAKAVEQFASDHSLRLDKCPRGNAGWELTRPDDRGGEVFLLLLYNDRLGLGIGSVWRFTCPEMGILYSHFRAMQPCALTPEAAIPALGTELDHLSNVRFGYWTHLTPLQANE